MVAHEFILDMRGFKGCGIEAEDIAKRLMDYEYSISPSQKSLVLLIE